MTPPDLPEIADTALRFLDLFDKETGVLQETYRYDPMKPSEGVVLVSAEG